MFNMRKIEILKSRAGNSNQKIQRMLLLWQKIKSNASVTVFYAHTHTWFISDSWIRLWKSIHILLFMILHYLRREPMAQKIYATSGNICRDKRCLFLFAFIYAINLDFIQIFTVKNAVKLTTCYFVNFFLFTKMVTYLLIQISVSKFAHLYNIYYFNLKKVVFVLGAAFNKFS